MTTPDTVVKDGLHVPHIITDKRGHATVNGTGMTIRRILETLLTFRSIEGTASALQIGIDSVEAALAFAVAQVK